MQTHGRGAECYHSIIYEEIAPEQIARSWVQLHRVTRNEGHACVY